MKNLLHYFEVRIYKLAIWIVIKCAIRHYRKWGGMTKDIKSGTYINVERQGYWFEYHAFTKTDVHETR